MSSVFTKIINGDISCYKISENDHFIAFLDISPLKKGHTLIVPKKEIDYIFDLDSDIYLGLMIFAKKISEAIIQAFPCKRIGMTVIGLEVPHAHIHLIPINTMNDMNFGNQKLAFSKEEFIEITESIKKFL